VYPGDDRIGFASWNSLRDAELRIDALRDSTRRYVRLRFELATQRWRIDTLRGSR
jgi:hypothetical protein